jgi:hypothetical protein
MGLTIYLGKENGELRLMRGDQNVDKVSFIYYHNLGTQLIETLDILLQQAKISLADIVSFDIQTDLGPDSTGIKIAQAYIAGLQLDSMKPKA